MLVGDQDGNLHYLENNGSTAIPSFTARTGTADPFDGIDVGIDNVPTFLDVNGDGLVDLVFGERGGKLFYFENSGSAIVPFL